MIISLAGISDLEQLARLLWLHAAPEEPARASVAAFAVDLAAWWTDRSDSHLPFVARLSESQMVGMAWLAIVPRVPRPGTNNRRSADIQSVFVLPEHRGRHIGSALVQAATRHAWSLGASHVTVHSGHKALPLYERLGFASSRRLLELERGEGA